MAQFTGTVGDDNIHGHRRGDKFDMSQGGNDTVSGRKGDDIFKFGAAFNALDTVTGGEGNDTLQLDGDYQIPVTLASTTLTSIETIKFANGNNYNIALDAANVAPGETLTVDASLLDSSHAVGIDASAVNGGRVDFIGGAGNDIFYGDSNNSSNARIDVSQGGNDFVTVRGNETVYFGAAFTADDQVTATAPGFGLIELDGDYSGGLTLGATTATNLSGILMDEGHDYNITLNDSVVTAGHFFIVALVPQTATDNIIVDGSSELDGTLLFETADGNDTLTGGAAADIFYMFSGRDTIYGGGGDDTINANELNAVRANDVFDGGSGMDTMTIFGNNQMDLTLLDATIQNIETLNFGIIDHPTLVLADGNVGAGQSMAINYFASSGPYNGTVDGSAETDGTLAFTGSFTHDTMIGGQFTNSFNGKGGGDDMTAGDGADTFVYSAVTDSLGPDYDHVTDFDWVEDVFDTATAVTGIAANIKHGSVSLATFAVDLKHAIGANLGAGEAVIFQAKSGDQAGKKFLVVDQNGEAGFQGTGDLVIWLEHATGTIDLTHFI